MPRAHGPQAPWCVLQIQGLRSQLDALYQDSFSRVTLADGSSPVALASAAAFGKLGREQAKVRLLLTALCRDAAAPDQVNPVLQRNKAGAR